MNEFYWQQTHNRYGFLSSKSDVAYNHRLRSIDYAVAVAHCFKSLGTNGLTQDSIPQPILEKAKSYLENTKKLLSSIQTYPAYIVELEKSGLGNALMEINTGLNKLAAGLKEENTCLVM